MGIVVEILVNIIIWPERSSKNLIRIVINLFESFNNQYQENLNNFRLLP